MYVAKLMYHRWEEEPISGIEAGYKGTFAIFFYGCNLRCVYCQNSRISRAKINDLRNISDEKVYFTPDKLSDEMLKAEKDGAYTISFITGVFYHDEIRETIKLVKEKGLKIPIVYNSSGYELSSHIKMFDGLVDIYLPDFKYFDDEIGKKYSHVSNYSEIAKECIEEMHRQVGKNVIVRHLVLPTHTEDSKKIIKYLYDTYGDDIRLSIMSQYTPMLRNEDMSLCPELQRKLTKREYQKVVDYALNLGIKNAFIQEGDVAKESFIPEF